MKNLLIISLIFLAISCTNNPQDIINKTIDHLSTNKALKYNLKKLTIQGNSSDTIFINATESALFKPFKNENDLFDYKFIVKDSLIHPYWNVPMKNTTIYDGNTFKFESINPIKNQVEILNKSEIKASRMKSHRTGELPMLLKLLKGNSFVNRIVKDTVIANREALLITQDDTTGIVYELYIQKKQCIPTFLRIIENPKQPFIQEFNYSNFEKVDSVILVEENIPPHNKDIKPISKGDTIPDWNLKYLTGKEFNFSSHKGETTILCLSMINCGACQMATEDIKKLYMDYCNSSNIRFIVFYPIDRKEKLEKYVRVKNIDYPIVYNSKKNIKEYGSIINHIGLPYPGFIILDDSNKVLWMQIGYNSKLIKGIKEQLKNITCNNFDNGSKIKPFN